VTAVVALFIAVGGLKVDGDARQIQAIIIGNAKVVAVAIAGAVLVAVLACTAVSIAGVVMFIASSPLAGMFSYFLQASPHRASPFSIHFALAHAGQACFDFISSLPGIVKGKPAPFRPCPPCTSPVSPETDTKILISPLSTNHFA